MRFEKSVITSLMALGLLACAAAPIDMNALAQGGVTASDQAGEWMDMSGSFEGWNQVGDANWRIEDGAFVADQGSGHLVTEESYEDFRIRLEFWASEGANSGVFVRLSDPQDIRDSNAYEINIYDTRPDQTYRTGGIVNFEAPGVVIHTPGRWNSYDITMQGNQIKVKLNGITTAVMQDDTYDSGPISLQYGAGEVKFRNVQIRRL